MTKYPQPFGKPKNHVSCKTCYDERVLVALTDIKPPPSTPDAVIAKLVPCPDCNADTIAE